MTKKSMHFALLLLAVVLLVACNPPLLPGQVASTPTDEILADCFQSATAVAWLDENGNGIREEDEPPLPGIEFVLEPSVDSRTTSDENGVADIFATTPGGDCPENQKIEAVGFVGYSLTTPQTLAYESPDAEYVFGFQPVPETVLIETETYAGAIFADVATSEFISWFGEPSNSFWTPIPGDVTLFEAGLVAFLQESHSAYQDTAPIVERLPDYTRQYFGIVRNTEALIFANFFCDGEAHDWLETAVVVMDGGNCYFQVIYNADTNTYLSLSVNGDA